MRTAKVYRSGTVEVPTERGCEAEIYALADASRPDGHPSRTGSHFASPTLAGVARWVRGNRLTSLTRDVRVRELTVDADRAMVYSVRAWEVASSWGAPDAIAAYWNTGTTLAAWLDAGLDGSEWECLIPPADVLGVRPVGAARVIAASPGWEHDLSCALNARR